MADAKLKDPKDQVPSIPEKPPAGLPVGLEDYGEDTGKGMENLGADELVVPFFSILQSNSPQCDNTNPQYLPGAQPGMFIDTATRELFNTFTFVPCHRAHNFVRYIPRDAGGGFEGILDPGDGLVRELKAKQGDFGKLTFDVPPNPALNERGGPRELVETFYLFGFCQPDVPGSRPRRAMLSFKSTQIKAYKTLMTFVNTQLVYDHPDPDKRARGEVIRPPLWAHVWRARTVPQENKKGKFRGWELSLAGTTKEGSLLRPDHPLYLDARTFYESLKAGKAKVDFSQQAATGEVDEGGASF